MITNLMGRHRIVTPVTAQDIPNNPNNPYPANCTSDVYARIDHANNDFAVYRAAAIAGAGRIPRSGSVVEIEYDDGSEQRWQVGSTFSTSPLTHAVGPVEDCPP